MRLIFELLIFKAIGLYYEWYSKNNFKAIGLYYEWYSKNNLDLGVRVYQIVLEFIICSMRTLENLGQ